MSGRLRLGIVLALASAAIVTTAAVPAIPQTAHSSRLGDVPPLLGRWTVTIGAPEDVLPPDPRQAGADRLTFRSGAQVAYATMAFYSGQDDSTRRPSLRHITAARPSRVDRSALRIRSIAGTEPLSVTAALVHHGQARTLLVYWHELDGRAYGDAYAFRLALGRSALFHRRADSTMVRVAVPVADEVAGLEQARAVVQDLVPALHAATRPPRGT